MRNDNDCENGAHLSSSAVVCSHEKEESGSEADDEEVVASWVGEPILTVATDTYYSAFIYGGTEFKVGDCVWVNVADDRDRWVAVLESLWEDQYREKWFEGRWFYYPDMTRGCTIKGPAPSSPSKMVALPSDRELHESDHVDENTLETIDGKVSVLSVDEYRTCLVERSEVPEDIFFCQSFYRTQTGLVRPILAQSTRTQRALLYADRAKRVAKKIGRGNKKDRRRVATSHARPRSEWSRMDSSRAPSPSSVLVDQRRGRDMDASPSASACAKACAALQLSAVPRRLPCREREREEIMDFIRSGIAQGGLGSALYIAGMPGTGKTATVKEVVRTLMEESDNGTVPPFKFLEVNAMKLQRPHELYSILWRAVSGLHASDHRAPSLLERHFSTPSSTREVHVVLVDELDYMVTRKQKVLYNLFNWPTYSHSRLVVVGIANTMDLPERFLPSIGSRMGLHRVKFKGYTVDQIVKIMKARLEDLEVFEDNAVEICARKVASISGDVRRALQIARRAAELCDQEGHLQQRRGRALVPAGAKFVTIKHIQAAHQELDSTPCVLAIKNMSVFERLWLAAVVLKLRAIGIEAVEFEDVALRFEQLCGEKVHRSEIPTKCEMREIYNRLLGMRILVHDDQPVVGRCEAAMRLNLLADDVVYAISRSPNMGDIF